MLNFDCIRKNISFQFSWLLDRRSDQPPNDEKNIAHLMFKFENRSCRNSNAVFRPAYIKRIQPPTDVIIKEILTLLTDTCLLVIKGIFSLQNVNSAGASAYQEQRRTA